MNKKYLAITSALIFSVMAGIAKADEPAVDVATVDVTTASTSAGAVFTQVTIGDASEFQNAWKEPDQQILNPDGTVARTIPGLVWGNTVKNSDGNTRFSNQVQAFDYCLAMNPESERAEIRRIIEVEQREPEHGVFLPLRESFVRLREYMGAGSGTNYGYRAQILPGLADYWYWSSSVHPAPSNGAYSFYGYNGVIVSYRYKGFAVRCVRR